MQKPDDSGEQKESSRISVENFLDVRSEEEPSETVAVAIRSNRHDRHQRFLKFLVKKIELKPFFVLKPFLY